MYAMVHKSDTNVYVFEKYKTSRPKATGNEIVL